MFTQTRKHRREKNEQSFEKPSVAQEQQMSLLNQLIEQQKQIQKQITVLRNQIRICDGAYQSLCATNVDSDIKIKQLESDLRTLLTNNRQLESDALALGIENQRLKVDNANLKRENQQLTSKRPVSNTDYQQLQAENLRLRAENQTLKTNNQAQVNYIKNQDDVTRLLTDHLNTANKKIEKQQKEIDYLAPLYKKIEEQQKQIDYLAPLAEKIEKQEQINYLAPLAEKIEKLQKEIDYLTQLSEPLEKTCNHLKLENATLQSQIKRAKIAAEPPKAPQERSPSPVRFFSPSQFLNEDPDMLWPVSRSPSPNRSKE